MSDEFIVNHTAMLANYTAIILTFLLIISLEIRGTLKSAKRRLLAGYALFYITYVGIIQLIDQYITYRVYSFDHDGDKVFQNEELVGELGFLWQAMIQDTARNMSPISGLLAAAVGTAIAYGLAYGCKRLFVLGRT